MNNTKFFVLVLVAVIIMAYLPHAHAGFGNVMSAYSQGTSKEL